VKTVIPNVFVRNLAYASNDVGFIERFLRQGLLLHPGQMLHEYVQHDECRLFLSFPKKRARAHDALQRFSDGDDDIGKGLNDHRLKNAGVNGIYWEEMTHLERDGKTFAEMRIPEGYAVALIRKSS
jgi:hypothetical protein